MKAVKYALAIGISSLFFLSACNNQDETTSRLRITLVDNPAEYQAVNVDIQGVRIHTDGQVDDNGGGWIDLPGSDVGVKNLLDYTNGTELVLVDMDFPAGKISQIRLMLGEENSVVIDGKSNFLKTPSAQQSGLKLQVNEILTEGVTYEIKLDFDAARSVVHTGSDKYILKPVIRVITKAIRGGIKGSVVPAEENVAIYVINGEDTVATTYAPEGASDFLISGIEAGNYLVSFDPGEVSQYNNAIVEAVTVANDGMTDLGQITLEMKN